MGDGEGDGGPSVTLHRMKVAGHGDSEGFHEDDTDPNDFVGMFA